MISTITGEISHVFEDQAIIDVGGVGFQINLTNETCQACHPGQKKAFYTYLVVREDNLSLYGFTTMEERNLFIHLISVPGVGPRTGLATLSTLSPESIRRAVTGDQPEIFSRVPGIGNKTAQKMILELKGKIQPLEPLEAASKMDDTDTEVMEALTTLGYSIVEAQAALQSIGKNAGDDSETRLRKALQYFS
jgi:Holliday junction DNA helicase RuvA